MFNEDLSLFFEVGDFAVRVTHVAQNGAERVFSAIFDAPYLNAELGEYDMDTTDPRLTARWSDVAHIRREDQIVFGTTTYDVVTGPQPDGTGLGLLRLARAND